MNNTARKKKSNIQKMTLLAIFTAIILIMSFTPLGYMPLFGIFQITYIMIPVAIGGIMTDSKGGLFLGTIFGLTSIPVGFLQSITSPLLIALVEEHPIINSALIFVWLVIPRALMGFLVPIIFKLVSKIDKTNSISYFIASGCSALLNTVFYIFFMFLTFGFNDTFLSMNGAGNFIDIFIAVITINVLIEFVTALIVGGGVCKALSVYIKNAHKDA